MMSGITLYKNYPMALITPRARMDVLAAATLRQECNTLFEQGFMHFVLDLSQIPVIDSAGIATLVHIFKRCRQLGGAMQLAQTMSPATQRVLHLTRFDQIFSTIDQAQIARLLAVAASTQAPVGG